MSLDGAGMLPVATPSGAAAERPVMLGVRPGDLRLAAEGLAARVELVEELGDSRIVDLSVKLTDGNRTVKLKTDDATIDLREGQGVRLGFAPGAAHLFDRDSGERLN